jgi:hypothetical protein
LLKNKFNLDDTNSNPQTSIPITARLKEIKKRRALRGNQTVKLLINSAGKRTVVLLNPSFFYFWLNTGWLILPQAVCPPFFVRL